MENKVIVTFVALGMLLTVGIVTATFQQQANASQNCSTGPVCGGNGGLGGIGKNGIGCSSTQTSCNTSGGNSGNGGNGGNANPQGENGVDGSGATQCVGGHRTLTSSDGRTIVQAC